MRAIHISSAAPAFAKGRKSFAVEDFDLYCGVLSALCWRKYNGEITLCCDSVSANYYRSIGLEAVWNDIKENVPDDLEGINPLMFWAGGKLFALRETPAPAVMLDTDFIVWEKLEFGSEIIAAHRENIADDIYPPISHFATRGHIIPDFSETVLPLNTAFLYIPDNDFKEFYTSQAIGFMKSAQDSDDFLKNMVFAEQRMVAMCADYTGTPVRTLLDKDNLFFPQDSFTHLWGAKQAMRDKPMLRADFIRRCRERLLRDFPDYAYAADIIDRIGS